MDPLSNHCLINTVIINFTFYLVLKLFLKSINDITLIIFHAVESMFNELLYSISTKVSIAQHKIILEISRAPTRNY